MDCTPSLLKIVLELGWRQIAEGRMEASLIIDIFNESGDSYAGLSQGNRVSYRVTNVFISESVFFQLV